MPAGIETEYWPEICNRSPPTGQKMKFSIKDFFSKCDQIHKSHLLVKFLMEISSFAQSPLENHFLPYYSP